MCQDSQDLVDSPKFGGNSQDDLCPPVINTPLQVEKELRDICNDVLNLLDKFLIAKVAKSISDHDL